MYVESKLSKLAGFLGATGQALVPLVMNGHWLKPTALDAETYYDGPLMADRVRGRNSWSEKVLFFGM